MSKYPEHDKIRSLNGSNQVAGEFLDWIKETKGLQLCHWIPEDEELDEPEGWYTTNLSTTNLLYEFFAIDSDTLEQEKQAMLEELRGQHE